MQRSEPSVPRWIPGRMRSRLDLGELAPLDSDRAAEIDRLQRAIGANVAAYRAGARGRPHGLCLTYKTARLTPENEARLAAAEAAHPDLVLVAYARPLQRHAGLSRSRSARGGSRGKA
jgi:hypothetical protein